jgi:uncharacterized protein
MLDQTFVHVQGIGYSTERRLWDQGADCWKTFLANPSRFRMPASRRIATLERVVGSCSALDRADFRFFSRHLAARDHWRSFRAFSGRVAYLDIETDGSSDEDCVTVIGISDGMELKQYVRGENLLDFPEALEDVAVLVTFFGSGFDIPVLRRAFPRLKFDQLHFDLCPGFRRLGYRGGLKKIERVLGLQRSEETDGLDGWHAVHLWREWQVGSSEALQRLIAYNAEDVNNMVPLARIAYGRLIVQLREGQQRESDRREVERARAE